MVQLIRAAKTVEVPPRSVLEVEANIEAPLEGVWLVQEARQTFVDSRSLCPRSAGVNDNTSAPP